MCGIKRQHIRFKQQLNKIDSNHNKDYPVAFIDDFLYEAYLDYIDIFWGGNKLKASKYGFEATQERIDMVAPLVIDIAESDSVPLVANNEKEEYGFKKQEFVLGTDASQYMHLVRAYGISDCGNINIDIKPHDHLNVVLRDSYQQPSTKWKRAVGVIKKGIDNLYSLFVYYPTSLTGINGQYLKFPNKPFLGGYDTLEFLNGDTSAPKLGDPSIDLEMSDNYCNLLVKIATQNVSGNVGNYNHAKYVENKILNTN